MKWKNFFKYFFVAFLFAALGLFFQSSFWQINRVDCFENGQSCSFNTWSVAFNQLKGRNLLFLSSSSVSETLKNNLQTVARVAVKKKLPDTLFLEITLREPAVFVTQGAGNIFLDGEGVVLGSTTASQGLPSFKPNPGVYYSPGKKSEDPLSVFAAKLLTESRWRSLEPVHSQAKGQTSLEVNFKEGPVALFSSRKDVGIQLDSLQYILERTKMEGRLPERVDLRFDKPVVAFRED